MSTFHDLDKKSDTKRITHIDSEQIISKKHKKWKQITWREKQTRGRGVWRREMHLHGAWHLLPRSEVWKVLFPFYLFSLLLFSLYFHAPFGSHNSFGHEFHWVWISSEPFFLVRAIWEKINSVLMNKIFPTQNMNYYDGI
jgi:hypothetical protein